MIATGDDELGVAATRDVLAIRGAIARALAKLRHRAPTREAQAVARPDHAPFAFPIMLDVRARRAFVAGGGRESASKAEALANLGASVLLWAPVHDETSALIG